MTLVSSHFRRPFEARLLRDCREGMLAACRKSGLPEDLGWDLAGIADELFANVVEHSDASWLKWEVSWEEGAGTLALRLTDNGLHFDPSLTPRNPPKHWRGMGLQMVKRMCSDLHYRRLEGGANQLDMVLNARRNRAKV